MGSNQQQVSEFAMQFVPGRTEEMDEYEALALAAATKKKASQQPEVPATYRDIMDKAKEIYANGNVEDAMRLARIALKRRDTPVVVALPDGSNVEFPADTSRAAIEATIQERINPQPNPDGTYGEPPEGMFFNPHTGQYTSRKLLKNNMDRSRFDAFTSGGAQGVAFGGADEMAGGLDVIGSLFSGKNRSDVYGFGRERARAATELDRESFPGTSTLAEIGGAMSVPMATVAKGASLPVRAAQGAGFGAGAGAVYGFNAGEGGQSQRVEDAKTGAKWGAGFGAVMPLAGAGAERVVNKRKANKAIVQMAKDAPSGDDLRTMGQAAYKRVDDAGVRVAPEAFRQAAGDIVEDMRMRGLDEGGGALSLTPQSARMADILGTADKGRNSISFADIEMMRRKAAIPAGNYGNKTEQALGNRVIYGLDTFVDTLDETKVVDGDVANLPANIKEARETWGRLLRHDKVAQVIEKAQDYRSGVQSGLRNGFASLLRNKKAMRGFSEAEKQAMRNVVHGTGADWLVTQVGKMGFALNGQGTNALGGTLGVGGGATLGSILGGPVGGVVGGAVSGGLGAAARAASGKRTENLAEIARALVATGKQPALPKLNPITMRELERLGAQGGVALAN